MRRLGKTTVAAVALAWLALQPTVAAPIGSARTTDQLSELPASIKRTRWVRVVESANVPQSYVAPMFMRVPHEGGATEPLGRRIIELPEDPMRSMARDSRSGYVAYVPIGSIKRGEALVTTGGATVVGGRLVPGRTTPCGICHGKELNGMAGVPGLAGRSPIYMTRQIYDMQHGLRRGLWSELMQPVIANLTEEDVIDIMAYLASLTP